MEIKDNSVEVLFIDAVHPEHNTLTPIDELASLLSGGSEGHHHIPKNSKRYGYIQAYKQTDTHPHDVRVFV